MHVRDLAELAALISIHHQQLASASPSAVDESLELYWTASRSRLDRWCRALRQVTQTTAVEPTRRWSPSATQLVKEILIGEVLTRTFAAVLAAHDHYHNRSESEPIGRNILAGHLDARRRALRLVAATAHAGSDHVHAISALTRQCERWSDLLLAYLAPTVSMDQYAVDPMRVRDFALDRRDDARSTAADHAAVALLLTGVKTSFAGSSDGESPNADLNIAIAAAVIGCFGAEFFDSFGLLRSAWLERLQNVPDETLALINQLCQPSAGASAAGRPARRRFY